jgi:hypothetical protein
MQWCIEREIQADRWAWSWSDQRGERAVPMTDEQILAVACRVADSLDATRVSEMTADGWKATTMFEDSALIRFARELLKAAPPAQAGQSDAAPSAEAMFTWTGPKKVFDDLVRDAMKFRTGWKKENPTREDYEATYTMANSISQGAS